jgi:hypothetical protein
MTNKYIISLAGIVAFLAVAGTLIWDFVFLGDHDTILGLTVFTIAVSTFFGFIMAGSSGGSRWKSDKSGMRTAITAAIIITYLFMLSFITFLVGPNELSAGKKAYIDSFTSIVGITIAFYLGGSFAVQALGKDETTEDKSSEKKD